MPAIATIAGSGTPRPTVEQAPYLTCGAPGTWKTGQVVTCHDGLWNGWGITITRQWMRDAGDIGGQTAATYTLAQADETHKVRCRVIATPSDTNLSAAVTKNTEQTITVVAP